MEVEFYKQFNEDVKKLPSKKVRQQITNRILSIEQAESINQLTGIKKLTGFTNAYRMRSGDYRIGLFLNGSNVELARVLHRLKAYDFFL